MKPFAASFDTIMIRFTVMMMVVITGVLFQQWWLVFLGLPLFLSAITAVSFKQKKEQTITKPTAKVVSIKRKIRKAQRLAS